MSLPTPTSYIPVKQTWPRYLPTWLLIGAATLGAALVLRAVWVSSPTLDTWAFLDWGRDILGGRGLELDNRTFHPLPIVFGGLLSLAGPLAPPLAVVASLSCLVLLAGLAARAVVRLGCGLPAALLAAVAVLVDPLLNGLGYTAYVNLPFATLVVGALVAELETPPRRRLAWGLLIVASLVRPEGWAFLAAFAVWKGWWARPSCRLRFAAVALAPIAVWLGLELVLFGDPLYSFHSTKPPSDQGVPASPSHWFNVITYALPWPLLVALGMGIFGVVRGVFVRRPALIVLVGTAVALATTVGLAALGFKVPERHFSVLVALALVLAAAGTSVPARLLRRPAWRPAAAAAGATAVALLSVPAVADNFRKADRSVGAKHDTDAALIELADRTRARLPLAGCGRHSIALLGTIGTAELAWAYDIPFRCADDLAGSPTRVIVRPTLPAYERLRDAGLSDRPNPGVVPQGFRLVGANRDWLAYRRP